ncbi:hypothetical protein BD626DRAFT_6080 [Schizophyllum amplum]|uniref:Uncharacterized protein n=1 Tax=Schizophyllum amplum TaxID=97359 RepID=A0A550CWF1_9AGAR|nr:hypothetical protein BD626DRAFT_6080 [Auriculariopsis ampla]
MPTGLQLKTDFPQLRFPESFRRLPIDASESYAVLVLRRKPQRGAPSTGDPLSDDQLVRLCPSSAVPLLPALHICILRAASSSVPAAWAPPSPLASMREVRHLYSAPKNSKKRDRPCSPVSLLLACLLLLSLIPTWSDTRCEIALVVHPPYSTTLLLVDSSRLRALALSVLALISSGSAHLKPVLFQIPASTNSWRFHKRAICHVYRAHCPVH